MVQELVCLVGNISIWLDVHACQHWAPLLQSNDSESQAWAAFDASRRAQMRTADRAQRNTMVSATAPSQARAISHSPEPVARTASPVLPRYTWDLACYCALCLHAVSSVDSPLGTSKGVVDLLRDNCSFRHIYVCCYMNADDTRHRCRSAPASG